MPTLNTSELNTVLSVLGMSVLRIDRSETKYHSDPRRLHPALWIRIGQDKKCLVPWGSA
jgi:hypothetical protein